MAIVLFRVDDRLIHGQVVVGWGGPLHADRIVVRFDKRAHNPILREAALDKGCLPIPWLRNLPVVFEYP